MRLKDTKEVKAMIDRMNAQGGGTEVVANPELEGDEAALTGLEVAGTKYKVGGTEQSISTFTLHWDMNKVVDDAMPITNEDEIAILEQIRQDFIESGKMPVTVSIIGNQEPITNRYPNHNFSISYGTFALEGGADFCMFIEPFGFEYDGSVRYIGLDEGTWIIYGVLIE